MNLFRLISKVNMEEREFMDAKSSYLILDYNTAQIPKDKEALVQEVEKRFMSIFKKKPEQVFWCYGYDIACAGPIPEAND